MGGRRMMVGLTAAALVAGCSTHYVPHSPGRLSIVMQGGNIAYQRDGQTFSYGFAGGGLVDAVEGDPEATEAAETFAGRNVGGFVATLLGSACLIGGVTLLAVDQPPSSQRQVLGGGALLCGLAGIDHRDRAGLTAQPYQFDAINIYNDHAEERLRPALAATWLRVSASIPASPRARTRRHGRARSQLERCSAGASSIDTRIRATTRQLGLASRAASSARSTVGM